MADISIASAERDGSTITVTGSGITKTTTKFYLDGNEVPHETDGDTEARLSDEGAAKQVYAVKGEVHTDKVTITAKRGARADVSTSAEGNDDKADISAKEQAAEKERAEKQQEKEAEKLERQPDRPLPEAAGDLNQDPREPYPTGNPPDPRETFKRIHGHYPADETGAKDEQAKQMDADPKT